MRANRYVSYLAAEIEPRALANMSTFEREAEKTMQRIASAGSRGSAGLANAAMGNTVSRNTSAIITGGARASAALERIDSTQKKVSASATIMGASFGRAADALQIVQGPLGPLAGRLSALGQVLRSLTGFTLAGVLAGGGAFALGGIAVQYQKAHDALVPFFESQNDLNGAMNEVVGIAGRTRSALLPIAQLYATMTRVAKDAGLAQGQTARITETVTKAARIGGGSSEAQQAAIVQFTQALTANFHGSGQELQSILEQAAPLAEAIAHGLGVKTSQLKQLAKDGQLSTQLVVEALSRGADEIDGKFSKLPKRVGTSITELVNNLSIFVGHLDETTGATTGVANAISFLAQNLGNVVTVAGTVAAAFAADTFATAAKGVSAWTANVVTGIARMVELQGLQRDGTAVILGSAQAEEMRAQFAQQAAATEAAAAKELQASAAAYKVQLEQQIALIEKQIATQVRAVEMARTFDAASRTQGGAGNSPLVKAAMTDLNASEQALILTQQQLIATDAELAAANGLVAETTVGLVTADEALIVAETAAAASSTRLATVKTVLQGAMGKVQNAASGLVSFLGGAWGVAFAAAAAWTVFLATRTDAAQAAIDRFKGGEEALLARLENTTGGMQRQAVAATQLARALTQAGIAKANESLRDTQSQLGTDIFAMSTRVNVLSKDFQELRRLGASAQAGQFMPTRDFGKLQEIMKRNPDAAQGSVLQTIFGVNAGNAVKDVEGVTAAMYGVLDAKKALSDFDKRQSEKQAPLIAGGTGKPLTTADLNRQAAIQAATSDLARARAELAAAKASGPKEGEDSQAYIDRIATMTKSVNSLAAAHKSAGGAAAKQRHEQALLNKEMAAAETGRDKLDRLQGIQDQFTDDSPIKRLERLRDAADKAKRSVQDLVGERVDGYGNAFSQADADRIKAQIDATTAARERAPVTDNINAAEQELRVQSLIGKGLGDQAEYIRRKYELEKQVGPLYDSEKQTIQDQIAEQNRLNDVLAKRNAIIEINGQFLDSFRDSVESTIKSLLTGDLKGAGNIFKSLQDAFVTAKAKELTLKLVGDPGKKYRDDMTRGLNDSAGKLTGSADKLTTSATALSDAAIALQSAATAGTGIDAGPLAGLPIVGTPDQNATDYLDGVFQDALDAPSSAMSDAADASQQAADAMTEAANAIFVVGHKLKTNDPKGLIATIDAVGLQLGTMISGPNSLLSKVMSKLGTALEGAQYGMSASSMFGQATGINQSQIGAGIGGALGQVGGAALGKVVGGALGSALGPIGGMIGGVLGGTLFGALFGKKKLPSGGISLSDLSGNYSYAGDPSLKSGVTGAATDVTGGIQKVLDALGGTLGAFSVAIGQFDGDWRVNVNGQTGQSLNRKTPGTVDFNQDYEAAVKYAIMNAIQDGAIQGIRESTKRLLEAGQDLDAALEKALKFEDVFKELKRLKDPVGAAIDELNVKFQQLIGIFTEAGASAEEWGQLQELYDLQRADAIAQATKAAVSTLQDFITSLTSGSDSPLSKRTVYNNAKSAVDAFRADISAGKPVDQDALTKALSDFESASQDLYGSRGAFYADFNDILALAQSALANVPSPATPGTLPPSPFDSLTPIAQQQLGVLTQIRDLLGTPATTPGTGVGTGVGSTIGGLPYYGGAPIPNQGGYMAGGGGGWAAIPPPPIVSGDPYTSIV